MNSLLISRPAVGKVAINMEVRRMRGLTHAHLMRGTDENFYVVKFQDNPQGRRILINEWVATQIAAVIGLPVPRCEIVIISDWLIGRIETSGNMGARSDGLHFASRYVVDPFEGQVIDYMPGSMLDPDHIANFEAFAAALVFDKWLGNAELRQVVYSRRPRQRKYTVTCIDQSHCFNGAQWSFPASPRQGTFNRASVYRRIAGWNDFEPCLSRVESFDEEQLTQITASIPQEWVGEDSRNLDMLLREALHQKRQVRRRIEDFRHSDLNPMPDWK